MIKNKKSIKKVKQLSYNRHSIANPHCMITFTMVTTYDYYITMCDNI